MASYSAFFSGSATVAGALIGLLFVALSLSPERLRDARSIEHQAIAATAFTALVDALFVSLIGLQPGGGLQYGAVIFGALGLSSTIGLTLRLWRNRHVAHLSNRWPIFIGLILVVYTAQLITGLLPETPAGAANQAATFVYVMFGVGIARAWQLLGLKAGGILDELGMAVAPHAKPRASDVPPDPAVPPDRPDRPPRRTWRYAGSGSPRRAFRARATYDGSICPVHDPHGALHAADPRRFGADRDPDCRRRPGRVPRCRP